MHVPYTVWRECLAHSVSASPVALTPSVAPDRWHDPHTLASKEGESDVAISLGNGTPLALRCRGGVAGQRMGSHRGGHPHPRSHNLLFLNQGWGASHTPGTKLPTVSLDMDPLRHLMLDLPVVNLQNISLARTWSSCCFSTDFLEADY